MKDLEARVAELEKKVEILLNVLAPPSLLAGMYLRGEPGLFKPEIVNAPPKPGYEREVAAQRAAVAGIMASVHEAMLGAKPTPPVHPRHAPDWNMHPDEYTRCLACGEVIRTNMGPCSAPQAQQEIDADD